MRIPSTHYAWRSLSAGLIVLLVLLTSGTRSSAVGPADSITTVAGIGTAGGDGGPATSAQLYNPTGSG